MIVDFDINIPSSVIDNPRLYLRGQLIQLYSTDFPRNTWNRIKIEFTSTKLEIYKNETFLYKIDNSNWNNIFQLRVNDSELTFKNFCICKR